MVHRSADSRLLANLLQQEKDYSKQLGQVIEASNASLASFAAYAAASAPPTSHVIMDVAGALAAADEALRRYARGVDEWREAMRVLKDAEEEVGNILRDREILVTRLIKASKPSKSGSGSIRESLLLSNQRFPSSSSLSLSVGGHADSPSPPPSRPLSGSFSSSTKLAAAQTELQACETHLAAKERELVAKRNATIRDGMGARIRALVECGGTWTELGQNALRTLDELRLEQPEQRVLSIQDLRSPLSYIENNTLSVPEDESARPSSDFSSIGPSQSASQVNGHELPPPVSMASVMNSVMFGSVIAPGSTSEQTYANGAKGAHSHHSSATGSSIFSNPAVPATYQVETVTYAPAIAVHVAGKEAAHETTDNFPTIPLPAPHALDGYVYDIPTAAGPSGLQQPHSRSNSDSGHSTPQTSAFKPTIHTRHVLERRITEDSQEDKRRNSTAPSDDVSSFEEVKQESQLLEEGKLALVENPRFISEERRREIEKEKEKARREEERAKKEKGKQRDGDDNLPREKKRFGLFHHAKSGQEHIQDTRGAGLASASGSPGDQGSPSKSFLGSIRGLFGAKPRNASPSQQSPSRPKRIARAEDDSDHPMDSDDDGSPSKTPSRGLGLFRADKGKSIGQSPSPSGRWETRTDKNIQALARRGSFDGELVRPAPNRLGGGIAGAVVAQAGVVSATGVGRRTRTASEDGTASASRTEVIGGGGKLLKKVRGGAPVAAGSAVDSNVSAASSAARANVTMQRTSSVMVRPTVAKVGKRRSASLDVGENRKSWGEQTEESEGDGMIVDLGRRRRVASEVGGTKPVAESAQRVASSSSKKTEAPGTSKSALVERTADVFGSTSTAQGYASDTPARTNAGGVTKKKSLSKKRVQEPAPALAAPPVPLTTLQTVSAPASTVGHARAAAPTRKPSTKMRSPLASPPPSTPPAAHQAGGTTVLAAGGSQPSGVLVPQAGWNAQAQAQGGGLSRNNSVTSAASAPAGGAAARPKRKTTTLGQGMGGSGGVARRASLTHAPSPTKAEPAAAVVPLAPAVSLMSIVEDVARTNREGWQQDSKTRKSVGGTQKAVGMMDVVRAPPLMERSTLEALSGPAQVRQRAAGSTASLALEGVTPSRTGMFEIKAPGSVFEQRKADAGGTRAKPLVHTPPPQQQQQQTYARPAAAAAPHAEPATHANLKVPLRSALRGSRSPSPAAGASYTPYTPPPPVNGSPQRSTSSTLRRGAPAPEETDPSGDDASEVFYSDIEDFEAREATAPKPVPTASALPPMMAPNGHTVNGYAGKTPSEMSHSSTSTFIAGGAGALGARPPVEYADSTPRRRKSVRVSLQPTFSPSPPALDYYEDREQQLYAPWATAPPPRAEAPVAVAAPLPAPVATHAARKPAVDEQRDMWADSDDDEDEQYARAKRLLTRAAKKEKDMTLLASSRTH